MPRAGIGVGVSPSQLAEKLREEFKVITIYIDNGLDQDVVVQVKGNKDKSYSKSINVGSSFTVSANSQDSRTLTPDTSGYLPYLTVEVSCSVAPSSGQLDIYRIRSKDDIEKIIDALEIRDTNTHTPDTDPTKVLVIEW